MNLGNKGFHFYKEIHSVYSLLYIYGGMSFETCFTRDTENLIMQKSTDFLIF